MVNYDEDSHGREHFPGVTFESKVEGNARVGAIIGHSEGGLRVDMGAEVPAVTSIAERLEELRVAIRDARVRGLIDDETVADAEHELSEAEAALAVDGRSGRGVLALRKLKGLLEGVAGLGTQVVAVLAAVERLSS